MAGRKIQRSNYVPAIFLKLSSLFARCSMFDAAAAEFLLSLCLALLPNDNDHEEEFGLDDSARIRFGGDPRRLCVSSCLPILPIVLSESAQF
jgi:hypothetical protein